jgi:hypothetical protein
MRVGLALPMAAVLVQALHAEVDAWLRQGVKARVCL